MSSVLLTGSSRGIGLELVKKLADHVTPPKIIIAACRNPEAAKDLQDFSKKNNNVHIIQLDTTKFETFDKAVKKVESIVGNEGLNVLINNAGINHDIASINDVTVEELTSHYLTNTVGPIMLTKAFIPLLKKAAAKNSSLPLGIARAAVINVSSLLGSISLNKISGYHGYRESKAALNMATRSLSVELKEDGILATVLHPGWVQTDMGGPNADITLETSVTNIVKTLYSLNEKHNAGFVQYDGKELPCTIFSGVCHPYPAVNINRKPRLVLREKDLPIRRQQKITVFKLNLPFKDCQYLSEVEPDDPVDPKTPYYMADLYLVNK